MSLPTAISDTYALATDAVIRSTFSPADGWVDLAEPMAVNRKVLVALAERGVTHVNLRVTESHDPSVDAARFPDFTVRELTATLPKRPALPTNDELAEMVAEDIFALHRKHPTNKRIWAALLATPDREVKPSVGPHRFLRHGNGLARRVPAKPNGRPRYRTWIRSRQRWSKTTYPLGGALPG